MEGREGGSEGGGMDALGLVFVMVFGKILNLDEQFHQ